MSGGIALPQALQLISGVPLMKVASVFAEKLSITKRLDGGPGLQGLMTKVLNDGNLSSVMQNPMGALIQTVQSQASGVASQLLGMSGVDGLISAMSGSGGLSDAMNALQAAGDNLAGLTNGAAGFFSMLGHANTQDMAGSAMPGAYGIDVVTGPLTAGALLSTVSNSFPQIVAQVQSGAMTIDAATAWAQAQTAAAMAIVNGSANALAWSAQNHPLIAVVSSVAGSLAVPPTFDDDGYRQEGVASGFQGVLASIVQPDAATAIAASLAAQIAHTVHDAVDVASMISLGDD